MSNAATHPDRSTAEKGPIVIDWAQDGSVQVLAHNRHRFTLTMQQAADACAQRNDQVVFAEELQAAMRAVHGWIQNRFNSVFAAYFAVVDRQLVFFVVPASATMDFALSDEISDLEVQLFHDFANLRCEVRQIPGHDLAAISTFLNPGEAILLHGNPIATSETVAP